MSHDANSHHSQSSRSNRSNRGFAGFMTSPLLWGGLMTFGFYNLIPYLPIYRELAVRYHCGHPIEYATTAMFFIGIAILLGKALGLMAEKSALSCDLLFDPALTDSNDIVSRATAIDMRRRALPSRLRETAVCERIRDACAYVRDRRTSEGLEDHLKYIAELAAERLHSSYSLVRTTTWAVPILGFLGTVVGITVAIGNLDFQDYEKSMHNVVGGLAVAFDTTALSLALSMVLVFFSYVVERAEGDILVRVEDSGISRLAVLLPPPVSTGSTFNDAEAQAAKHLLERTESVINRQTQLWQESLEAIRSRWNETLEQQKSSFDESLRQGHVATLSDHAQQLAAVRKDFLEAFGRASDALNDTLIASRTAQSNMQELFRRQLAELWLQVREDIAVAQSHDASQRIELFEAIARRIDGWQEQLAETNATSVAHLAELQLQREALVQIVGDERQLAKLQERLNENLETVRTAEAFEETLHSLSAAVHLLTTRVKPKAA